MSNVVENKHKTCCSIFVNKLRDFLDRIKVQVEEWAALEEAEDGLTMKWDGYSKPVEYFLKKKKIKLFQTPGFEEFFSTDPATIAVSYVWAATPLCEIVG